MNVEASGLLSMFSGLGGLENIEGILRQDGALPGQFAEALTQQLDKLRQAQATASPEGDGQAILQDFTAFSGINLPPVNKEIDIDLEATLQALSEVLKNIDEVKPQAASVELEPLPGGEPTVNLVENQQIAHDASVSARDVAELVSAIAADLLVKPNSEVDLKAMAEEGADVLTPKLLRSQPAAVGDSAVLKAASLPVDENGVKAPLSTTGLNGREGVVDPTNLESEGGDEQASDSEQKRALPEFNNSKVASEGEKADLPKMAADIAMLNRSVITEAKNDMPAMSRQIGHPQWGQELSDKLVWMHKQAVPAAELNLNPRHLGPVSIRVDVNQDQTTISFSTQHAVVKEAIEAALPKLREMLASQQLNLVDVNVSQQQSEQKQAQSFFQMSDQQGRNGRHDQQDEALAQSPAASVVEEIEAGRAITTNGILSIFA